MNSDISALFFIFRLDAETSLVIGSLHLHQIIQSSMPGLPPPNGAPAHWSGVQSEETGKACVCVCCQNQQICISGASRESDSTIGLVRERLKKSRIKFWSLPARMV